MRFGNGYLGVCLVIVAIVLTVGASYVLSMDVEEREVTRYSQVAELTGLFDSEQSPAYINYNPSTNYTGYYTDESTKYFDGVKATTTLQPNQYRLNLAPESDTTGELDLSDVSYTGTLRLHYWYDANETQRSVDVNRILVSDLITALGTSAEVVTITSDTGNWTTGGFFTFYLADNVSSGNADLRAPNVSGMLTFSEGGRLIPWGNAEQVPTPILGGVIDSSTNTIVLYSDADLRTSIGTFTASSVYVLWNNDHSGAFKLGSSGEMRETDYPPRTFMDIRSGVQLEG